MTPSEIVAKLVTLSIIAKCNFCDWTEPYLVSEHEQAAEDAAAHVFSEHQGEAMKVMG